MPDDAPHTLSATFTEALARLSALPPEEFARREGERRRLAALAEQDRVLHNAKTRGTPREANVRRAVLLARTPRTAPLDKILRALEWRAAQRLPTGELPGLVLILAGGNGSGKTVGASWLVARAEGTSLFLTADELGEFPDNDWSTYVEMRERWKTAGVLVIDDVGAEKSEKAARRVIERTGPLLLDRFNNGRASIVTTNRPAPEFCEVYLSTEESAVDRGVKVPGNARLTSRLADAQLAMGCPYWYELRGAPSYRGPEGAARLAALPLVDGRALGRLA